MRNENNKKGIEYFIELPEGYQFVDENGNVINASKIVLEKKQKYPQSYRECLIITTLKQIIMEEKITEAINDKLESEKYSLKFYLGSISPDELERARQDALNDIENEKRN